MKLTKYDWIVSLTLLAAGILCGLDGDKPTAILLFATCCIYNRISILAAN